WMLASAVLAAALAVVSVAALRSFPAPKGRVVRFEIDPTVGIENGRSDLPISPVYNLSVSPDAQRLAYVALTKRSSTVISIRKLDALEFETVPGTDGGSLPFWSPDGRALGFFAEGKLKTVDLSGLQRPEILADALYPRGGAWNLAGMIVYATNAGLYRI